MPDENQCNPEVDKSAGQCSPDESCESVTRRRLVGAGFGVCAAGYAAAIGYPISRYLAAPVRRAASRSAVTEVALPEADQLEPGRALMFMFGTRPAVLIHHQDDSWVCFDAVCTHLHCTVKFQPDKERIYCACHGGVYDPKTGDAVAGPPPQGLTRFNIRDTL